MKWNPECFETFLTVTSMDEVRCHMEDRQQRRGKGRTFIIRKAGTQTKDTVGDWLCVLSNRDPLPWGPCMQLLSPLSSPVNADCVHASPALPGQTFWKARKEGDL